MYSTSAQRSASDISAPFGRYESWPVFRFPRLVVSNGVPPAS
jgi:hypothetical protein